MSQPYFNARLKAFEFKKKIKPLDCNIKRSCSNMMPNGVNLFNQFSKLISCYSVNTLRLFIAVTS